MAAPSGLCLERRLTCRIVHHALPWKLFVLASLVACVSVRADFPALKVNGPDGWT